MILIRAIHLRISLVFLILLIVLMVLVINGAEGPAVSRWDPALADAGCLARACIGASAPEELNDVPATEIFLLAFLSRRLPAGLRPSILRLRLTLLITFTASKRSLIWPCPDPALG